MPQAARHLDGTDRLREITLYLSIISEGDEAFGSEKLNKLLFLSDFAFYRQSGLSLTRQEYQKFAQGPAPHVMQSLLEDIQSKGELTIALRTYHGCPQRKPIALRQPDLSGFTGSEIACVNEIVNQYRSRNAQDISLVSHDFLGWQLANEGETIPYASALLDDRPLTAEDIAFAQRLDLSDVETLLR